jgi:hypothetical protein
VPPGAAEIPCRGVGVARGGASLGHRHLAARPGASHLDRVARAVVIGPHLLKVMEHVLGAVSRPHGEQLMIVIAEAAATSHGDEPRIPDLGQDHLNPLGR